MSEIMDYGTVTYNGVTTNAPNVNVNTTKHTQVYMATHEGESRLPSMNRSYISFKYGGKDIEDFGFIAITENNALQRNIYAQFSDNITESDVWDGQIYWSSHYHANTLELTLVTDGVTEAQLDDFKQYFCAGKIEELILAEHPNRAILARIANAPQFSFLPFEQEVEVKVAGNTYNTSTTLYKGHISLNFVMDDPFWYSKVNIIEKQDSNLTEDDLKSIYEDRIPSSSMMPGQGSTQVSIGVGSSGSTIDSNTNVFYYYAGIAPCEPTIHFTLTPTNDANNYINFPKNIYDNSVNNYNIIYVQGSNLQEFKFTAPAIIIGINQAIKIFRDNSQSGLTWEDIRTLIRDNVKHYAARQYANYLINKYNGNTLLAASENLITCATNMKNLLKNNSNNYIPMTFHINTVNHQCLGEFSYRSPSDTVTINAVTENVSDMLRSKFIILDERNIINDSGNIAAWTSEAETVSYKINADCTLTNFYMNYKYLYY